VLFTKGDNFRQPIYVNWLSKKQVSKKIDQFAKIAKKDFKIAVYPSWKLFKSGTLLIDSNQIIIEACKGHVSNLIRRGNTKLSLIYGKNKKLLESVGESKFLSSALRRKILSAVNKVKRENIILEWAIDQNQEFIFYKLEDLKEAARSLIKKYS